MSDYRLSNLLWAVAAIGSGILLLLFNFDVLTQFEPLAQYVLAGFCALGGLGFFGGYLSSRENWWRLIPAWTLLTLAGMVLLSTFPALDPRLIAALLFVGLALAFVNIYLLDRVTAWWAIIPGGFMFVLSLVIALSSAIERVDTLGTLLFVGMGFVFYALYLLAGRRRQWWALIPGSVLTLFGLFIFALDRDDGSTLWRWWPLGLIVLGVLIGWRAARRAPSQNMAVHTAPRRPTGSNPSPGIETADNTEPAKLGDYSRPVPGASVEILPDPDES